VRKNVHKLKFNKNIHIKALKQVNNKVKTVAFQSLTMRRRLLQLKACNTITAFQHTIKITLLHHCTKDQDAQCELRTNIITIVHRMQYHITTSMCQFAFQKYLTGQIQYTGQSVSSELVPCYFLPVIVLGSQHKGCSVSSLRIQSTDQEEIEGPVNHFLQLMSVLLSSLQ